MFTIPCKGCNNKHFRCFLYCEGYKKWREERDKMQIEKWNFKVVTAPIRHKWRCI